MTFTRPVYGVGINDLTSFPTERGTARYYQVWNALLERCYSERYQSVNPSYRGCSVSSEWIRYSNFRDWMRDQKHDGLVLDKDLLYPGNKLYSAETCVFIPLWVNCLLASLSSKPRSLPMGVIARGSRFQARYKLSGKTMNLGAFDTPEAAHAAYRKRRLIHLRESAERYLTETYVNPTVSAALFGLCERECKIIEMVKA